MLYLPKPVKAPNPSQTIHRFIDASLWESQTDEVASLPQTSLHSLTAPGRLSFLESWCRRTTLCRGFSIFRCRSEVTWMELLIYLNPFGDVGMR